MPDLRFINPTPSGLPFSQGVQAGNLLFVAGQVGSGDGVAEQTLSAIDGVRAVLAEAGGDLRPARATVRAELMGPDYLVEVQAIAVLDG